MTSPRANPVHSKLRLGAIFGTITSNAALPAKTQIRSVQSGFSGAHEGARLWLLRASALENGVSSHQGPKDETTSAALSHHVPFLRCPQNGIVRWRTESKWSREGDPEQSVGQAVRHAPFSAHMSRVGGSGSLGRKSHRAIPPVERKPHHTRRESVLSPKALAADAIGQHAG